MRCDTMDALQAALLQFFNGDILVGEYADIAGDLQSLFGNLARLEVRVLQQCKGRRLGEGATGTDRHEVVFGFDDVAVARDDERAFVVRDTQQGLESTRCNASFWASGRSGQM